MLTTLEIIDRVYTVLKTADFDNLHKDAKPENQAAEMYTVINSLPISGGILQECQLNVNIHAADLDKSRRISNRAHLLSESTAILAVLENYCDNDIDLELVFQAGPIREPEVPEHLINLRFIARHVQN